MQKISSSGVGEADTWPFVSEVRRTPFVISTTFVFSAGCVLLLFAWQGWTGFSLWDEGFLWYGAQRVVAGEIPLRDFMSYDPGRYYWCAAFMRLLGGTGILQLRVALAAFQVLALIVALLLLVRDRDAQKKSETAIWCSIVAVTLLAWMFPRHKLIDVGLSIFLIGVLSYLLDRPKPRGYFLAGLAVGLTAVFGRNHGVYGALGSAVAILWLACKSNPRPGPFRAIALWGPGVGVGFSPILITALAAPGFAQAFWQSIRFLVERQATNIALPTPWPWTARLLPASAGRCCAGRLDRHVFRRLPRVRLRRAGLGLSRPFDKPQNQSDLRRLRVPCATVRSVRIFPSGCQSSRAGRVPLADRKLQSSLDGAGPRQMAAQRLALSGQRLGDARLSAGMAMQDEGAVRAGGDLRQPDLGGPRDRERRRAGSSACGRICARRPRLRGGAVLARRLRADGSALADVGNLRAISPFGGVRKSVDRTRKGRRPGFRAARKFAVGWARGAAVSQHPPADGAIHRRQLRPCVGIGEPRLQDFQEKRLGKLKFQTIGLEIVTGVKIVTFLSPRGDRCAAVEPRMRTRNSILPKS